MPRIRRTQTTWARSDLKASFLRFSFHGKDTVQVARGIKQVQSSIQLQPRKPWERPPLQDMQEGAIRCGPMLVPTDSCPVRLKAHSTGGQSCQGWRVSQLARASETIDLRKDSTAAALIDRHYSVLYFKSYPYAQGPVPKDHTSELLHVWLREIVWAKIVTSVLWNTPS